MNIEQPNKRFQMRNSKFQYNDGRQINYWREQFQIQLRRQKRQLLQQQFRCQNSYLNLEISKTGMMLDKEIIMKYPDLVKVAFNEQTIFSLLVSILSYEGDWSIRLKCLQLLKELSGKISQFMTEEIIIEQNMLKTLLICLKDFTNVQEAINASNIICNLLSLNSEVSIALCNEQFIQIGLQLFERVAFEIQDNLIFCFANLTVDNKQYQLEILEGGFIQMLKSSVIQQNELAQSFCNSVSFFLYSISFDLPNSSNILADFAFICKIVWQNLSNNNHAQSQLLKALSNFVLQDLDVNKDLVEIFKQLPKLLTNSLADNQIYTLKLIGNIMCYQQGWALYFINNQLLHYITQLLNTQSVEVKSLSYWLISNMLADTSKMTQIVLSDNQIKDALIQGLNETNQNLLLEISYVFKNITCKGQKFLHLLVDTDICQRLNNFFTICKDQQAIHNMLLFMEAHYNEGDLLLFSNQSQFNKVLQQMHESNLISVIESIKTDNTEIQDLITNLVNQYYEDSDNLLDEVEIYKF